MLLNLKRFLFLSLTVSLLASFPATAEAAAKKKKPAQRPDRYASIVIDASTGYVFSERNADKRLYPASLTKMMTLYLTFEALDNGRLSRNASLDVSRHAASQEPSSLALAPGTTVRAEDCILGVVTKSANDCAVVLAEAVGGSESRFAALMTQRARQLGMRNTNFVNASGLFSPSQYSSARDMAILSQALIHDHPRYYKYFSTASFTYKGVPYNNHNKLMATYKGMDGLKTGYVYASGYNLAASAVRDGTRLIGVVFGGQTSKSRNSHMAEILDAAFESTRSPARVAANRTQQPRLAAAARPTTPPPADAINDALQAAPVATSPIGLVEQGDTETAESTEGLEPIFQPQPLNTNPLIAANGGAWAIQIGAFSSHDASQRALEGARSMLSGAVAGGTDSIAPLMTPRGMVYRARLSGFGRDGATAACRILKGNCLVLSVD